MDTTEDKETFVNELNYLLIECGAGYYDHLREVPLQYQTDGASEFVTHGDHRVCVTGDSLTAMLADMRKGGIL